MRSHWITQQISPKCGVLLFFLLSGSVSGLGQERGEDLSIGLNIGGFGSSLIQGGLPSFATQAEVRYRLSDEYSIEAGISFSTLQERFDTLGGNSSITIRAMQADVALSRLLLRITQSLDLTGRLGAGVSEFATEGGTVSLGALGTRPIPPGRDVRANLIAGLQFSQAIVDRVSLRLGSTLYLYTPLSKGETGFSFLGGFNIDVL